MRNSFLVFLFLTLCSTLLYAQKGNVRGTVYETGTKKTLAFVSVVIKESNIGKVTDIDGVFSFSKTPPTFTLKISYVGYVTKEIKLNENDSIIIIELDKDNKQLETVIIGKGENPAFRIIRLLIENKKNNNPELFSSFKYNSYTISTLGIGNIFSSPKKNTATKKQKKELSIKDKRNDSISIAMFKKIKENHLMVTESYIERKFRFPNRSLETVIASKVSGLKQAPFAITTSTFQPFGFYKDYLQIGLDAYVSPLIKGSIALYNFRLKETIINESDTSFVIQFEPKKNKNFKGLKGLLYINSDGYAIENVIISPADEKGIALYFKLQQQYKKIKGKWFPHQLNTAVTQKSLQSDSSIINWDSRSYISNISIGDYFPLSTFSDVDQVFEIPATKKMEIEWDKFRTDSLSVKEKATYKIYDDLPATTLNKINRINKLLNIISLNAIPWGKVDIPFKYILSGTNVYEGIRVGAGLQTNPTFNKYFSLGAFAGYGIKDKAWKYGGNVFFTLKERTATLLTFNYERNVVEPGNVDYFTNKSSALINQTVRKFIASRMDSVEQFKIDFTTKIIPTLQTNAWLQLEKRNTATYDYLFENSIQSLGKKQFKNTEIGIGFRYTKGESFIRIGRAKIQNKPATTLVLFQVSKGLKTVWNSDLDYTKIALQCSRVFNSKWLGQTFIQLDAGKIWGDLPYSYLFNTMGSTTDRNTNIYIPNTFQTVGLYEFSSSQTASLFIQNDFGNLLFKPKSLSFRPTFLFIQNIGIGMLNNADNHKLINFKSPSKGLYESGIMVKNIYRTRFSDLYYVGFGGGVFYRYGYYHLDKKSDNWALKVGMNISF